jgi:hypothetical protein
MTETATLSGQDTQGLGSLIRALNTCTNDGIKREQDGGKFDLDDVLANLNDFLGPQQLIEGLANQIGIDEVDAIVKVVKRRTK